MKHGMPFGIGPARTTREVAGAHQQGKKAADLKPPIDSTRDALTWPDLRLVQPDRERRPFGTFVGLYVGSDLSNEWLIRRAVGKKQVARTFYFRGTHVVCQGS
jgi:hypothetical protein